MPSKTAKLHREPGGARPRRRVALIAPIFAVAPATGLMFALVVFALVTADLSPPRGVISLRISAPRPLDPPLTERVVFVGPTTVRETSLPNLLLSQGRSEACGFEQAAVLALALGISSPCCRSALICVEDGVPLRRVIAVQQRLWGQGLRQLHLAPAAACVSFFEPGPPTPFLRLEWLEF